MDQTQCEEVKENLRKAARLMRESAGPPGKIRGSDRSS